MSSNLKLLNVFKFSFDNTVWNDPTFTGTTDEQLEELLEFVATKDISTLSPEDSYGVFLSARREMYWKLATSTAPLYGIEVDGTKVNKNERFDHYIKLIETLDKEIQSYIDSGGSVSGSSSTVTMGEALLTNRHFDKRNYENTKVPIVTISLDTIYKDKLEISWVAKEVTRFYNYIVYLSSGSIIDEYKDKELGETNITNEDATKVFSTFDKLKTKYRIEGLIPNTKYHVAVICFNANTVYGYDEVVFTTLPEEVIV